jgi:hypothetical protein
VNFPIERTQKKQERFSAKPKEAQAKKQERFSAKPKEAQAKKQERFSAKPKEEPAECRRACLLNAVARRSCRLPRANRISFPGARSTRPR